MPPPDAQERIQIGRHTRADIAALLGSPTNLATFDDRSWYYVSQRTETVAFFAPEVIEQKVFIVRFDADGRVEAVETRDLSSAQTVEQVDRVTPTAGHSLSLLEQFFGSIGQYGGKPVSPTTLGTPGGGPRR